MPKAGLGRLGIIAIDGTKIAANAGRGASCRRQWLQEQVDAIAAEAAEVDAAEDAVHGKGISGNETPRQLRGRRERNARIVRCLAEVKAEEAARGMDDASIAARAQASVDHARQGRSGGGPLPPAVDRVAVAAARVEAARERMQQVLARKREQIAQVREQLRLAKAGLRPKPNLGLFSFDETKGREVSRARRWLTRAEKALATEQAAARQTQLSGTPEALAAKGRRGKNEPRTARRDIRRNVTDPDSRLMSAADGAAIQTYNAQLAVAGDGLILAPELVQDANDKRQFQPMSQAAVRAAKLVHAARCDRKCLSTNGCCVTASSTAAGCPCTKDSLGVLLLDNGHCTNENLDSPGPGRLIATRGSRDRRQPKEGQESLPGNADARTRMDHRLATADGAALYKHRAGTVEPVNGHLKERTSLEDSPDGD